MHNPLTGQNKSCASIQAVAYRAPHNRLLCPSTFHFLVSEIASRSGSARRSKGISCLRSETLSHPYGLGFPRSQASGIVRHARALWCVAHSKGRCLSRPGYAGLTACPSDWGPKSAWHQPRTAYAIRTLFSTSNELFHVVTAGNTDAQRTKGTVRTLPFIRCPSHVDWIGCTSGHTRSAYAPRLCLAVPSSPVSPGPASHAGPR